MKDFHKKSLKDISLWAWAASTLPVVGLFCIILFHFYAPQNAFDLVILSIGTVLFFVSVVWWWWVMYTIAQLTSLFGKTSEEFAEVKKEVKEIKKEIVVEKNASNRKRREQKDN